MSETHPIDLLTAPLKAVVERNDIDPAQVEDVVVGCVTETGEQGANMARSTVFGGRLAGRSAGRDVEPILLVGTSRR